MHAMFPLLYGACNMLNPKLLLSLLSPYVCEAGLLLFGNASDVFSFLVCELPSNPSISIPRAYP